MKHLKSLSAISLRASLVLFLFILPFFINAQQYMRANLKLIAPDGSVILMDGNLTNYDGAYSNNVDGNDAWKLSNFGENFGILREGHTLVVERRSIIENADTTFFKMWNMQLREYQLEIITEHFNQPRISALVKDKYLNTINHIALNDTTRMGFEVNSDSRSYDPQRFELIFSTVTTGSVPVSFIDFDAYRKDNDILVEWKVINEVSVDKYVVQHSGDGKNFTDVTTVPAMNVGQKTYSALDNADLGQDNFYRIKAIRFTGSIEYSVISKVHGSGSVLGIYPNPATDRKINMQISTGETGLYQISLISSKGKTYKLDPLNITDGQNSTVLIIPGNIVPGIYRLKVITPGNKYQVVTVFIK